MSNNRARRTQARKAQARVKRTQPVKVPLSYLYQVELWNRDYAVSDVASVYLNSYLNKKES